MPASAHCCFDEPSRETSACSAPGRARLSKHRPRLSRTVAGVSEGEAVDRALWTARGFRVSAPVRSSWQVVLLADESADKRSSAIALPLRALKTLGLASLLLARGYPLIADVTPWPQPTRSVTARLQQRCHGRRHRGCRRPPRALVATKSSCRPLGTEASTEDHQKR
jgi:hypothetical protein